MTAGIQISGIGMVYHFAQVIKTPNDNYLVSIKIDAANSRIRTYSLAATGPTYLGGKSDTSLNSFHPIKVAFSPTGGVFFLPYWGS